MNLQAIAAGAAIVGGVLNFFGQRSANKANAKAAKEQMEFQERMSNTEWQRGTADMRAAGINPALAYSKGGASSPSGTAPHLENALAGAGASAKDAATSYTNMVSTRASLDQQQANTRLTQAQAKQLELESADRAAQIATSARQGRLDYNVAATTAGNRIRLTGYEADARQTAAEISRNELRFQPGRLRNEQDVMRPLATELLRQQVALTSTNSRSALAQAQLYELSLPGARANANAWESLYGKNLRPYLNDAKTVLPFIRR